MLKKYGQTSLLSLANCNRKKASSHGKGYPLDIILNGQCQEQSYVVNTEGG
jgi:hypothetical protein